jgi:EmrB/QacA subfamily drug resistance transporter
MSRGGDADVTIPRTVPRLLPHAFSSYIHVIERAVPRQTLVLVVVMLGVMISAIDATIVILGLPVMIVDLRSDLVTMVWVIIAYLLTLTVLGTQVGRLGDMYGRVRMYNVGFGIFTLGSVLCGLSQTGSQLIALRVVQAVGGSLIAANSGAIIADNVPAQSRGRAFGLTSIGFNVGAILGILLGGALITFVSWRFIFYINLPIGLLALAVSSTVLHDRTAGRPQPLDIPGVALFGSGLLLVLLGVTRLASAGWSALEGWMILGGAALLGFFVVWEKRSQFPMLDLSLFQSRVLTASIFAAFFQALGSYAVLFLVIMYLQGVRGLSPFAASLLLTPGYIIGGFLGPWSGRLSDRVGARLPASIGLCLQIAGVLLYSTIGLATPFLVVVIAAIVNGCGSGFFYPANSSAVLANAPRDAYGVASGLLRTFANVGMVGSFAVALLATGSAISREQAFAIFLGTSTLSDGLAEAFVRGLHAALLTATVPLGIALVLSVLRGTEVRGRSPVSGDGFGGSIE